MRSKKYIVGRRDLLEIAVSDWTETGINDKLIPIELELKNDYRFDFSTINNLSPVNATAFAVWGNDFMNFQRLELFMELKKRGFHLPPLICKDCFLDSSVEVAENSYISKLVQIGARSRVNYNTNLMPAVQIGSEVVIGASCFIGVGAILMDKSMLGEFSIASERTFVSTSCAVGKNCFLGSQTYIKEDVMANSYLDCKINAYVNRKL
jgi:UDP-3-O-[3-hydroxymyristoyl] glucosamine N-acyltransferase